jgi:hypothetical protein
MPQTSRVRRHAKNGTHGVFGIVAALALCRGDPAMDRCHPGAETDDRHQRGCATILPQVGQGSGRRVDHPAWGRTFWKGAMFSGEASVSLRHHHARSHPGSS